MARGLYLVYACILFILVSITLRYLFNPLYTPPPGSLKTRLEKEGVVLLPKLLSNVEMDVLKDDIESDNILQAKKEIMQSKKIRKQIDELLGEDYVFQDYIFLIKKSRFHTCHRDYNGDLFNDGQKNPSYTIIFYLTDMGKCLDVLPESHQSMKHNYNWTDYTQTILCGKGDALLFNANLVHNGSLTDREENMRIQMKLSHKSDLETLSFYNQYNKVLNPSEDTTPMFYKQVQKHVSCQFPVLSQYVKQFDNNKTDKEPSSPFSAFFSSFFPSLQTAT
jgi:hypothetical protein